MILLPEILFDLIFQMKGNEYTSNPPLIIDLNSSDPILEAASPCIPATSSTPGDDSDNLGSEFISAKKGKKTLNQRQNETVLESLRGRLDIDELDRQELKE
jgi:hypothetical protein